MTSSVAARPDLESVLAEVLARTDVLVYAKDLAGRYLFANDALTAVLAVPGGLSGRTDHELFPAEVADGYRRSDARVAATGLAAESVENLVHADGTTHTYRSTTFPLRGGDGAVYGVAGVSTDVTELTRTVDELRSARAAHESAEHRWRALVEQSPVPVAVIGADGRFAYANPQAVLLYGGRSDAEVVGRPALDVIPARTRPATSQLFRAILAGGAPVSAGRCVLRRLDGAERVAEVNAAVVTYAGGPAVQVELRDVTAQAAAEEALAASERRFRAVFEASPVGIGVVDERGCWVACNPGLAQIAGVETSDLVGRSALELTHPDDRPLLAVWESGRADGAAGFLRAETRLVRPDGELRWVWCDVKACPGPEGQRWTVAITQDVTERKIAEIALAESKAELAAIARVARCGQSGSDPRPLVVTSVRELSGASTVSLLELAGDDALVVTACDGIDVLGTTVPLWEVSKTADVWRTGEAVFLADAAADPMINPALLALDSTVSILWQPIVVAGAVLAVLAVTWRHRVPDLDDRAVRAVRVLADETGTSLHAGRLRAELERSAATDPLTGSLNRRAWDAEVRAVLARAAETGEPLTLAVVDLDHFKSYNDTHGHAAGDAVLRDFAAGACAVLRKGDVFARWGGEEFIVALPGTAPKQAAAVLDRVRTSAPAGCSCSIGHTVWKTDEPLAATITRADIALYAAKAAGRNRLASR